MLKMFPRVTLLISSHLKADVCVCVTLDVLNNPDSRLCVPLFSESSPVLHRALNRVQVDALTARHRRLRDRPPLHACVEAEAADKRSPSVCRVTQAGQACQVLLDRKERRCAWRTRTNS